MSRTHLVAGTPDNTVLHATTLGRQGGTTTITTLNTNQVNLSNLASVQLLGDSAGSYLGLPSYAQDGGGLHITMPRPTRRSAPWHTSSHSPSAERSPRPPRAVPPARG